MLTYRQDLSPVWRTDHFRLLHFNMNQLRHSKSHLKSCLLHTNRCTLSQSFLTKRQGDFWEVGQGWCYMKLTKNIEILLYLEKNVNHLDKKVKTLYSSSFSKFSGHTTLQNITHVSRGVPNWRALSDNCWMKERVWADLSEHVNSTLQSNCIIWLNDRLFCLVDII